MAMRRLNDLAEHVRVSTTVTSDDSRRYVGLEHLISGNPSVGGWASASSVRSNKFVFRSGDVLYGKLRPYLDKAALAEFDGVASTDLLVLRPREDVDPRFLVYTMHSRLVLDHAIATTSGVNHPRTSWSALSDLEVFAPPLEEQRRIANILSTIQAAKMQNGRLLGAAKNLKAAFTRHFLSKSENDYPRVLLAELGVSIETGPFGSQLHAHEYTTEGVRVLNPMHLGDNGINSDAAAVFISEATAERLARHRLREGDVVVPRRGDLSRYALIRNDLIGQLCGTGSIKLRFSDQRLSSAYFALYFGSAVAQSYLKDAATGTIMPNISPKVLEGLPVLIPPRDVQDRVVAGWAAIDRYQRAVALVLDREQRLFQSALESQMVSAA